MCAKFSLRAMAAAVCLGGCDQVCYHVVSQMGNNMVTKVVHIKIGCG